VTVCLLNLGSLIHLKLISLPRQPSTAASTVSIETNSTGLGKALVLFSVGKPEQQRLCAFQVCESVEWFTPVRYHSCPELEPLVLGETVDPQATLDSRLAIE
jgi:hypothetical protein